MAVTHSTGANGGKVAIGTEIKTQLNNGTLRFKTASDALKATMNLGTGATVNSTTGVITFTAGGTLSDTSAAAGTITKAEFRDSGGTQVIMSCSVGQGSGDIDFDDNVWEAGQTVKVTSLTYTPPA